MTSPRPARYSAKSLRGVRGPGASGCGFRRWRAADPPGSRERRRRRARWGDRAASAQAGIARIREGQDVMMRGIQPMALGGRGRAPRSRPRNDGRRPEDPRVPGRSAEPTAARPAGRRVPAISTSAATLSAGCAPAHLQVQAYRDPASRHYRRCRSPGRSWIGGNVQILPTARGGRRERIGRPARRSGRRGASGVLDSIADANEVGGFHDQTVAHVVEGLEHHERSAALIRQAHARRAQSGHRA